MSIEIKTPKLPESVADATISKWHKKIGEFIGCGETIVDLETDKVVLEIPAPIDGVIKEIIKHEGDIVVANDILAIIKQGEKQTPEINAVHTLYSEQKSSVSTSIEMTRNNDDQSNITHHNLSPAVYHLVNEYNLNPSNITGSGKSKRLTKEDVLKYISDNKLDTVQQKNPIISQSNSSATNQEPNLIPTATLTSKRIDRRVPMTRLRARIAERLIQAQQSAALLTTFNELNISAVINLRNYYKESFQQKHGVKLGFMSFFIKASIEALKRFPQVNSTLDDNEIVYHNYYDIGIAVSTQRGLIVPIIRDAETMTLAQLEKQLVHYAEKARTNALTIDDLTGGTFSITNGGVFGSMLSTPIVNPPQSAILAMHNITERPVVEDGKIVIRPMMYLALTYDHRVIDGKESVLFLKTIKELVEDPTRLFLEI